MITKSLRSRRTALLAAGVLLAGTLGSLGLFGATSAADAATTSAGILYHPSTASGPTEDASYPRVIRLQHSGTADGTMF